jgi:cytochrome P450
MLRDSRVYVDPDNFNPDRFLATEGHVPEMDPSEVGVFGFGRRCVNTRSGTRMKFTERFSSFSKCPGQHLAELSTWLGVASVLATFDVSPALDDNGKPIDVRYALGGINHIVK